MTIKTMKVAFYLNNPTMPDKDYSNIMEGNPGVAGSEYEFLLVPYLLEKRDNGIEPFLCVNFKGKFPHKNVVNVDNLDSACSYCVKEGITEIVVDIKYFDKNTLDKYGNTLSVMIWAHNNVSYRLLNLFWSLPYLKKIINCGREELELYRDHIATLKSTYVYNIFPFKEKDYYLSKIKDRNNHNVVFMGSITKEKGLHILARAWKDVLKKIPDAQLYVIGSGKLYNRDATMGKYGIADKRYEDMFMPYLTDKEGSILPSVHFLGLLCEEKYEIMGSCKVAVPNPTGFSECLPITSIEMQLMGCNITTINHSSFLDTVMNKKYLFRSEWQLSRYLCKRLLEPSDSYDSLYNYVTSRFGIVGNIERWERIILNIDDELVEPISENRNQFKGFKDYLLKLKKKYPLLNKLPNVELVYWYTMLVKRKVYDFIFAHKL